MPSASDIAAAPRPLLIHAAGHACLGWWHAPVATPLPLAVVMASSWGEEDMSAYDGQRRLADALAEAGLGVLRFDGPDTGDSSAANGDADLPATLAALDAAATAARALSGCERLAFVGLRLGALLAAHAVLARDDVEALVALLPVASGRSFVREQRMLGARLLGPPAPAADAAPDAAEPSAPGRVVLGGFTLPPDLAASLSALKWPDAPAASLRQALLLTPTPQPGGPIGAALKRMGARVTAWSDSRLDQALDIAHRALLAPAAIAEIGRWLCAVATDPQRSGPVGTPIALPVDAPWLHVEVDGIAVRERPCVIPVLPRADGPDAVPLVGTLGERVPPPRASGNGADPADVGAPAARRAIVLLSSGRERRVGPHRLWVPFARHRAACGDVVLRLDVSGIGDSASRWRDGQRQEPDVYDARSVDDVRRAVDWLRREHGVGACTVMGICSGAYHAWRAALAGVDVQQVVVINPVIFHWKPGMSIEPRDHAFGQISISADARRGLRDPTRWLKLLKGQVHVRIIVAALWARARHAVVLRLRDLARLLRWPLTDDLAAELSLAAARGVSLDFVFSCNEPGLVLLREETGHTGVTLERDNLVKVSEIAHADHTFAGTAGRAGLYARLDVLLKPAAASPMNPVSPSRLPSVPVALRS